ncbi:hypothetical protein FHT43_006831 [Mycolicibacterium sp. BK607]|uniref:hypothetical protein n=1 Tax=Mycolicibacterium sp. BK607 TaxID=2587098 RepID=UPI0016095264|nr:hypothetical protein [Mycolicibacterium sp. BK607]MBB3636883.1 hypothetical protein [Mycolicibacterium sp. BK607]
MSEEIAVPAGMTALVYPEWASAADPDIPRQLAAVAARLYELFGSGDPAASALPEFPFSTATGQGSGIDAYDNLKRDFQRIESEFDAAAQAFKSAVQDSAYRTRAGRDAINNAIATFNSTAETLDSGDWDGLLQAESTMLTTVKTEVTNAAQSEPVPLGPGIDYSQGSPLPGIDTPPAGTPPAAAAKEPKPGSGGLAELLSTLGSGAPLLGGGLPMAGNPLGGLTGLPGLTSQNAGGGMGNPGGRSAAPTSMRADDVVEPLSPLDEAGDDGAAPSITPLNPGPQNPPPPATAAPTEAPGTEEPGHRSAVAHAAHTVTLPDGTTVEAPNKQAAEAAQNAIDTASPDGDAAQKAYSPTGLQLPEEGKNLGAKVDPADMAPGDVLKWQDKTMVAVAPDLVADPTQPGVTHTLEDVLKDQRGFQGVFRPTAAAPPTAPAAPPPEAAPRSEVPPAPSATVPQPAPPSPFESLL